MSATSQGGLRGKRSVPLLTRCPWCLGSEQYIRYHDEEWGVPVTNDRRLFEMLTLEGAQAGLSWSTILKKRAGYRKAFAGFDPRKVARFSARDVARLMLDEGIVRNRLKIESTISNASAFLAVQAEFGRFSRYLEAFFSDPATVARAPVSMAQVPASTPASDALSRDLRKRDFRFVGTTICYAFMQAVGLVNDHLAGCFRRAEVGAADHRMRRKSDEANQNPGRAVAALPRARRTRATGAKG